VVEPTHLKKICSSNWIIFSGRGENEKHQKIVGTTTWLSTRMVILALHSRFHAISVAKQLGEDGGRQLIWISNEDQPPIPTNSTTRRYPEKKEGWIFYNLEAIQRITVDNSNHDK